MEQFAPMTGVSLRPPDSPDERHTRKFRSYPVRGPMSEKYFTLRIAAQAAAVPPLPFESPGPSMWQQPSKSLRHRWHFLNKEAFLLPSPRQTPAAAPMPFARDQARQSFLPHLQSEQLQRRSLRKSVKNGLPWMPQGELAQPQQWGAHRGLPENLQDKHAGVHLYQNHQPQTMCGTFAEQSSITSECNSISNPNDATLTLKDLTKLTLVNDAETAPHSVAESKSPDPSDANSVASLPEWSKTTLLRSRDASAMKTATADAAQRLRVTLLTTAFHHMVTDVVTTHAYDDEEQLPIIRHAKIFMELPLQSRYHEMHPLCNIRLASPEFRQAREAAAALLSESYPSSTDKRRLGGFHAAARIAVPAVAAGVSTSSIAQEK